MLKIIAMQTGFYNISTLDKEQLKAFYMEALMLSHYVVLESKYTQNNKWRGRDSKYTIQQYLDMVDTENHNVCVDRSIQNPGMPDTNHADIGFKLDSKYDKDWHQITMYVSLPNMEYLAKTFNLIMQ